MKISICAMKQVEVDYPVFEKILESEKEHYKNFYKKDVSNPITDKDVEQAIAIVEELSGFKFASSSKEDFKDFTIFLVDDVDSGLALLES